QPPAYGDYGANQQPEYGQAPTYGQPPAYGQPPMNGQQPGYGQPQYGQPYYGYPVPPRNMSGDRIASIILLVLGGLTTLAMIFTAIALPTAMEGVYRQYGLGHYIA